MRTAAVTITCLVALASAALATPQENPTPGPTPSYYLRGYYKIGSQRPTWQTSDESPWTQADMKAPWVNARLVKWGYVPFTHDAKNYYCLIEQGARTGSHVPDTTFLCGAPDTVQWLFQNNWKPSIPAIGGGPPLESSLRLLDR